MSIYIYIGGEVLDFRGLIMNIIYTKLTHSLGLDTKFIMSLSGNTIYLLIRASDQIIKKFAEKFNFSTEYEVGSTDLSSLEPCDNFLRKYRTIKGPPHIKSLEEYLDPLFLHIDKQSIAKDKLHSKRYTNNEMTEQHWAFYESNIY